MLSATPGTLWRHSSCGTLRVLALVPYPTLGASNRLRVEQYVPFLAAEGIHLTLAPFFDDSAYRVLYQAGHVPEKALGLVRGAARRVHDALRAARYDLVLVHRETAPIGPPLVERLLAARGIPYVFDFDDAIFLPAISPVNRAWARFRRTDPGETARRASLVIAGNDYLADWARAHNPRVVVLPTPVDTARHTPRHAGVAPGRPVIGWVGSSSTAQYLHLLDDVFERLARRRDFLVRVVGGSYVHGTVSVECIAYSLADEPEHVRSLDVGVLPEPDDPWTRGKGAFKALLYMASAVPVVASRVGVNEKVVGPGGYCVDGVDAWVDALDRLLGDARLRADVGSAGRAHVEAGYSLAALAPRFAAALREGAS